MRGIATPGLIPARAPQRPEKRGNPVSGVRDAVGVRYGQPAKGKELTGVAHGSVCERCAMCDPERLTGGAPTAVPRARHWTLVTRVFRAGADGALSHPTDELGPHVRGAHSR
jgi:hypothetical protein